MTNHMKRFVLYVTKRTGYCEVRIERDFGSLTESESDKVMGAALAQFDRTSVFAGPTETREIHGDYEEPNEDNGWKSSVCFDPGLDEIDFRPGT